MDVKPLSDKPTALSLIHLSGALPDELQPLRLGYPVHGSDGGLLLTGQTSEQTVELYATAVNPAGESVPSATINVAVA